MLLQQHSTLRFDLESAAFLLAGLAPILSLVLPPLTDAFALIRVFFFSFSLYQSVTMSMYGFIKVSETVREYIFMSHIRRGLPSG